jgi:hypothetical protein
MCGSWPDIRSVESRFPPAGSLLPIAYFVREPSQFAILRVKWIWVRSVPASPAANREFGCGFESSATVGGKVDSRAVCVVAKRKCVLWKSQEVRPIGN